MPDWDAKPPEDRDVYGTQVTQAETVDARQQAEVLDEQAEEAAKPLGLWSDTWRRLKRNKLALIGLGIIIVFITVGTVEEISFVFGKPLTPYPPDAVNYALSPQGFGSPPSLKHPFGTDYLGRDVLSRVLDGDPHRHARRHHRRRHRADDGPHPRADLGLLRRRRRLGDHAHRRHLLRLPLHPVRAADHERARARLPERLHRHRHPRLGDLRPHRARPDPQRQVDGVRRGGALAGRERPAHHLPPRAAQQHGAGLRGRRHGHRRRHRHRGGPELPRHRGAAADAVVGPA